jgi:hypothetical protein
MTKVDIHLRVKYINVTELVNDISQESFGTSTYLF